MFREQRSRFLISSVILPGRKSVEKTTATLKLFNDVTRKRKILIVGQIKCADISRKEESISGSDFYYDLNR
jgi:hypothetical protein